jgi:hypothetical protein
MSVNDLRLLGIANSNAVRLPRDSFIRSQVKTSSVGIVHVGTMIFGDTTVHEFLIPSSKEH